MSEVKLKKSFSNIYLIQRVFYTEINQKQLFNMELKPQYLNRTNYFVLYCVTLLVSKKQLSKTFVFHISSFITGLNDQGSKKNKQDKNNRCRFNFL